MSQGKIHAHELKGNLIYPIPNARRKWFTDDKGFHAFASAYLHSVFAKKGYAALTTIALGAVLEVKDAYMRYEVVPILGGDGFSYKDLTFDVGGAGPGLLRDLLFKDKESNKFSAIGENRTCVGRILKQVADHGFERDLTSIVNHRTKESLRL